MTPRSPSLRGRMAWKSWACRHAAGRQCYHCKQWIDEGEEHNCWTTTEAALIEDLSQDLKGSESAGSPLGSWSIDQFKIEFFICFYRTLYDFMCAYRLRKISYNVF